MAAVSTISTMKVDCPTARSSCRPTRVNILSTSPIVAESAGTKLPVWAISVMIATWRIKVDFPAMFGPVRITTCSSEVDSLASLGTKDPGGNDLSTTGCLP